MRRYPGVILGAFAVLAIASCNRPAPGGGTSAAATQAVALVDGYMASWNAHDAPGAAAVFADSGTYLDASVGKPEVGRANAQHNVIEAFFKAAPDCRWTRVGDPVVSPSGDAVAFEWTFTGTNTGEWGDGTKATGKPFSIRGLTLIRISGGKVTSQFDSYDALGFYKQLGLM